MKNIKAVCLILQQTPAYQPIHNKDIYLLFTEQGNSKTATSWMKNKSKLIPLVLN